MGNFNFYRFLYIILSGAYERCEAAQTEQCQICVVELHLCKLPYMENLISDLSMRDKKIRLSVSV